MVLPSWAPSTGTYAKKVNISKISISILTNVGEGGEKCMVIMSMMPFTKIMKFVTPGSGV